MRLAFELSMPSNNSWDGKWSGDGKCYVIVKEFRNPPRPNGVTLPGSRFSYSFGDGWVAAVSCREVDSATAAKLRKESKGFYGYDWMVDSIIQHGKILVSG